ncbi:MAG TPA: class I SAM-dependent rRNA methyltransferase [Spirochaetota bacterium]|nr:class I SAM-dependent rRNA methyltransferase [Spirochaetota bacterium]
MYRQIKIKHGREKSFINRHPWVFSGALASLPDYSNGEIVEVITSDGVIMGYGFFSPDSRISCRIFEFTDIHVPKFDADYFAAKISRASALRGRFIDKKITDCWRLLHAEGDFFPGLIIDVYGDTAVVQALIMGVELILEDIADGLESLGYNNIFIKNSGVNRVEGVSSDNYLLRGEMRERVAVMENSLKFTVDIAGGQKTGFFLDQRDNRELVRSLAHGKRVLNAFCYTGGFSVYALAGGAESVHSVDISGSAINITDENINLNFGDTGRSVSIKEDCFEYLRKMDSDYFDVIILDPPAFVKHASGVDKGARGYKDINLNALRRIKKDSLLLTFSCSQHVSQDLFRKIVFSAAADAGRNVRVLHQLSQGADHPVSIFHPEGEYLKGLLLHVE